MQIKLFQTIIISSKILQELNEELFKSFGITKYKKEKRIGSTVFWHYLDGTYSQLHKDTIEPNYYHVRCNVMLKKPMFGGDAIIDNTVYKLNKHDAWIVIASEELHGSSPISGGDRIIYSTGAILDDKEIKKLL